MIRSVLLLKPLPGKTQAVVDAFRDNGVLVFGQENSGAITSELSVSPDGEVLVTSLFPSAESYQAWLSSPVRDRPGNGVAELVEGIPVGRVFDVRQSLGLEKLGL